MKTDPIETDLVKKCIRGDRFAPYQLYDRYKKAMYNICLRMMNSTEDAEDALQNAFVDVFRKLPHFRFESTLGAWIKRIVINQCLNQLKKKKIDWLPLEPGMDKVAEIVTEPTNHLTVNKIKKGMTQLPDGYRVVFSLYLFEGYDHNEIADILGISVSTSKSQFHRAKAKMNKLIANGQS